MVTLGSPHHGTSLADLAGDARARPVPGRLPAAGHATAPLLAALNRGDETPAGPTWVSIWTTQDETVTPPDSARLDGALNLPVQSVCADAQVGHGELPPPRSSSRWCWPSSRAGPPVALGAADCAGSADSRDGL